MQLIYVSNIKLSTEFYQSLFNAEPVFHSPRCVAFSAGGKAFFTIWTGGEKPDKKVQRFSEIGIMLSSSEAVDALYQEWTERLDLDVIQQPHDEVFGRTFLIKDPDGHIIRVCPLD